MPRKFVNMGKREKTVKTDFDETNGIELEHLFLFFRVS